MKMTRKRARARPYQLKTSSRRGQWELADPKQVLFPPGVNQRAATMTSSSGHRSGKTSPRVSRSWTRRTRTCSAPSRRFPLLPRPLTSKWRPRT
ncbi:Protein of unknown function [Cotesia congregata]|uniref:Uncharacterized protein n=1 Tax=Cotesia congregata TaxID=51543 RepID=A0A8J2H7L8_COTCN|nr:Protein of unknown function [Cotesia congregata]